MAQQGRNARCSCGSGRKVKHCCGVRRGPSEAELAKAFLHQQARSAALVLAERSDAQVAALLDAAVGLPRQDVSMQLPLPGLRDAGRVLGEVAAAVAVEQASRSTTLLRASLLAGLAVSVGAARTPGGLLVVSHS